MSSRYTRHWESRHIPKSEKPPIIFSSIICDICGKARGGHFDHTRCSKIRKKRALQAATQETSGV